MENIRGGYHIISNVLNVVLPTPVEIRSDLRLCKANDTQVLMIQNLIDKLGGLASPRSNYECNWITTKTGEKTWSAQSEALNPQDWRYYILAFSGNGNEAYPFLQAANLVDPTLSAFAHVYTDGEFGVGEVQGWGADPLQGVIKYSRISPPSTDTIDDLTIKSIQSALEKWIALDKTKHAGIERAVTSLYMLNRVSPENDLRILGMFSILEMLLTHNPNDKEIGDSLSHQISTKVPLLSARFPVPLEYNMFGSEIAAEKIWKTLYAYRSYIAHGNPIDFNDKKLKLLRDKDTAVRFILSAVRRVVRHALDEPDLVDALKPI